MTRVTISDSFDSGNMEMVEQVGSNGSCVVSLRVRPDVYTELEKTNHMQYFCFRAMVSQLRPGTSTTITYAIENANDMSYPEALPGYTVFYTTNMNDTNSWRRALDTSFNEAEGKMYWTHRHERNGPVYFCYFPPYTYAQHMDLIDRCAAAEGAVVESAGQSLQGREMEVVRVGSGDRVCWVIHRQHPGESMAEYFAEGLLTRLLGLDTDGEVDGKVREALTRYTFYIVPNMCPDGSVMGHLRTNSAGANLNREWDTTGSYFAPTLERSPEVYHVRKFMDKTGVDCFVDVHGDEELPYNFLAGPEQTDNWGPRMRALHGAFVASYCRANPDMQQAVGYDPPEPHLKGDHTKVLRTSACAGVANRFDCLSMTLEMPFKDCATNPDPQRGWSAHRSRTLGASLLDAIAYVHPYLRSDKWDSLPPEDAYVRPTEKLSIHNQV